MQQQASTYSVHTYTLTPWVGSKVKTFFSESTHIAYQKRSTMQAHILSLHPPPWGGAKGQHFL